MVQRQVLHGAAHHDRRGGRFGGVFARAPFVGGFDGGGLRKERGSLFGLIGVVGSFGRGDDEGVAFAWFGGEGEQLDALRGPSRRSSAGGG